MYLSAHRSYAVWLPARGLVIWRLSSPCAQTFLLRGASGGPCGLGAPAGVAAGTSVCHGYRRRGRPRTQLGVGICFVVLGDTRPWSRWVTWCFSLPVASPSCLHQRNVRAPADARPCWHTALSVFVTSAVRAHGSCWLPVVLVRLCVALVTQGDQHFFFFF